MEYNKHLCNREPRTAIERLAYDKQFDPNPDVRRYAAGVLINSGVCRVDGSNLLASKPFRANAVREFGRNLLGAMKARRYHKKIQRSHFYPGQPDLFDSACADLERISEGRIYDREFCAQNSRPSYED